MITITEKELELILEALNIAGSVDVDDERFDNLYDELKERAN